MVMSAIAVTPDLRSLRLHTHTQILALLNFLDFDFASQKLIFYGHIQGYEYSLCFQTTCRSLRVVTKHPLVRSTTEDG